MIKMINLNIPALDDYNPTQGGTTHRAMQLLLFSKPAIARRGNAGLLEEILI